MKYYFIAITIVMIVAMLCGCTQDCGTLDGKPWGCVIVPKG
jgi:hypothetical protein